MNEKQRESASSAAHWQPVRLEGWLDYRGLPGKYRHGLALGPPASELYEALIAANRQRAIELLKTLSDQGRSFPEIEREVLVPAMMKLGEMWVRGRFGDQTFQHLGQIAEQVEREFRQYILAARPGAMPIRSH